MQMPCGEKKGCLGHNLAGCCTKILPVRCEWTLFGKKVHLLRKHPPYFWFRKSIPAGIHRNHDPSTCLHHHGPIAMLRP